MKDAVLLLTALLLGLVVAGGCRQSPPPHSQPQPFQGFDRPSVQHQPQPPGGAMTSPGTSPVAPQPAPTIESQTPGSSPSAPLPQQPEGSDRFQSPSPEAALTD